MKPLAMTIAVLGLAGTAISPAFAGQTERMTIAVPTADINLATAEGQKRLDQRLEKAARTVCRVTDVTTGTRTMSRKARDCLAKARTDAKQQVAALTASEPRGG